MAVIGLAATIGVGAESERDTGDPFTYYRMAGDVASNVQKFTKDIPDIVDAISVSISSYPDAHPERIGKVIYDSLPRFPQIAEDYLNRGNCNADQLEPKKVNIVSDVSPEDLTQEEFHRYARYQAEINGLTLADESEYLGKIDKAESVGDVLSIVNSYARNHSLKITIPESDSVEDFSVKYFGLGNEQFDITEFKSISKRLLRNLYFIPTELTKSAEVQEVKIVGSIYHIMFKHLFGNTAFYDGLRNEISGSEHLGGLFNPVNRIIYINMDDSRSANLSGRMLHELSHAILFKTCGLSGTLNDKEFASLNPEGFLYGDKESLKTYKGISSSRFGYNNVFEDAAYTMGDIVLTFPPIRHDSLPPVQKAKAKLIEQRAEQLAPGFSNYRRALMPKPRDQVKE